MFDKQRETATKAMYSALGAPVVAKRLAGEYSAKFTKFSDKVLDGARDHYDESVDAGKKVAARFQEGGVVEEIQTRVDMDKVQDRVGKLRDQLDAALESWRENFAPSDAPASPKKVEVEEKDKPAATEEKTPAASAKKTTAKKAAPKTTAKKTTSTAKKTTTTAAKKTTTTTKSTAKKTTSAAKKTPAKSSTDS